MTIRCTSCLTQIAVEQPVGQGPTLVTCPSCSRRYRITRKPEQTLPDRDRYRQARDFARGHSISDANAYSVLEGLMTLEEAKAIQKKTPAPVPEKPAEQQRPIPRVIDDESYDPAFSGAVKRGYMTPAQAARRGNRQDLAKRLADRHRLPMSLALMVADNRTTISSALARKGDEERQGIHESGGGFRKLVAAVAVLGIAGWFLFRPPESEAQPEGIEVLSARMASASATSTRERTASEWPDAGTSLERTTPRFDSTDQLVALSGPDPRTVLIAYCESPGDGQRRPLEIAPAVPPNPGLRYGLFRLDSTGGIDVRAIVIRRDQRTGQWTAGDGRKPITSFIPPVRVPGLG